MLRLTARDQFPVPQKYQRTNSTAAGHGTGLVAGPAYNTLLRKQESSQILKTEFSKSFCSSRSGKARCKMEATPGQSGMRYNVLGPPAIGVGPYYCSGAWQCVTGRPRGPACSGEHWSPQCRRLRRAIPGTMDPSGTSARADFTNRLLPYMCHFCTRDLGTWDCQAEVRDVWGRGRAYCFGTRGAGGGGGAFGAPGSPPDPPTHIRNELFEQDRKSEADDRYTNLCCPPPPPPKGVDGPRRTRPRQTMGANPHIFDPSTKCLSLPLRRS